MSTSLGRVGIESRFFHCAAFALTRNRECGYHDHRHGQDHAHEAGHNVELRDRLRIVERVDAQIHRTGRTVEKIERALEVVLQGRIHQRRERAERGARGDGIGGVCLDEQGGAVAAQQVAREIRRDIDDELHAALREQVATFSLGSDFVHKGEKRAVFQRGEKRAALWARGRPVGRRWAGAVGRS